MFELVLSIIGSHLRVLDSILVQKHRQPKSGGEKTIDNRKQGRKNVNDYTSIFSELEKRNLSNLGNFVISSSSFIFPQK